MNPANSKNIHLASASTVTTFLFVFFLGVSFSNVARGQDAAASPSPTPNPEMQRLEEEKARATIRKEIAEANKATAEASKAESEAKYPKPSTTPLAGTTTINEGAVIESQMMAYSSMAYAANRIIEGIQTHQMTIRNLAIYNERDINLLLSYRVATKQVNIIQQSYCLILAPALTTNRCTPPVPRNANPLGPGGPAPVPFTIAQSFLGAFVDMAALLRTNVDIKGTTFDIDEGPLVAEVFRAARRPSLGLPSPLNLYYPYVFPPNINTNAPSLLLQQLEDVNRLRTSATKLIGDLDKKSKDIEETKAKSKELKATIKDLENKRADAEGAALRLLEVYCPSVATENLGIGDKIDKAVRRRACSKMPGEKMERLLELGNIIQELDSKLRKAGGDLQDAQNDLATQNADLASLKLNLASSFQANYSLDDAVAQLKSINAQFDKFVNALVQVDAGVGLNPLTNYIKAENLLAILPAQNSYWLQLKVIKAGGNNRIKTNLIVDLFTGGNRISHSGGSVVMYHLFDWNGSSVASDVITSYKGYTKSNKVSKLPNSETDDQPKP